ncbi:protein kinase [Archangium sp.]|uniref:protein kinase n=1 Tax=Archangium sp. TaxID=1872627 RepID=UPI002D3C4F19|nr:protein kinase [Archangium sp.]HYO58309.1 protein kinase [Archangium sp.]
MGDTPSWSNGRLGPYHVGRRYWEVGTHLGRLHEANNVQTGAFAVVLTPGQEAAWPPRTAWTVRITSGVLPPFLSLEVEHAPDAKTPALHELTLTFDQLTGTLGGLRPQDRADVHAHLTRQPWGSWPGRPRARWPWLLAGAAVAVAAGLVLLAPWPRSPEPPEMQRSPEVAGVALEEPVAFVDMQEPPFPFIGYPMPDAPFKEQRKPPCLKGTEVEIRGGCWVTLEQRAPCPKSTAEHEGKCYMPVRKKDPEPRSLQP